MSDLKELAAPISDSDPVGPERAGDIFVLERLLEGDPGADTEAEREPNWRKLQGESKKLLQKSKDLRAAIVLTLSLLKLEGLAGLLAGLKLLRVLLEKYWDGLYPSIDAQDKSIERRIGVLNSLALPRDVESPYRFIAFLRRIPLAESPLGRPTLAELEKARRLADNPDTAQAGVAKLSEIAGAFRHADRLSLKKMAADIVSIHDEAKAIALWVGQKSPNGALSWRPLLETLEQMEAVLTEQSTGEVPGTIPGGSGGPKGRTAPTELEQKVAGPVQSRADVVGALDAICEFYRRHEPGSPIPFLLRRVRRLVNMDYVEALEELNPAAVGPFKDLFGIKSDKE